MAKPWNRMTREEQREESGRIARAERVAQGLPEVCDDPVILAKVARIAASSLESKADQAVNPGTHRDTRAPEATRISKS